jgi:hypothetical protein
LRHCAGDISNRVISAGEAKTLRILRKAGRRASQSVCPRKTLVVLSYANGLEIQIEEERQTIWPCGGTNVFNEAAFLERRPSSLDGIRFSAGGAAALGAK